MTKKELMEKIESFDDEAILLFFEDDSDFRDLSSIEGVIEVNTGTKRYIVFGG